MWHNHIHEQFAERDRNACTDNSTGDLKILQWTDRKPQTMQSRFLYLINDAIKYTYYYSHLKTSPKAHFLDFNQVNSSTNCLIHIDGSSSKLYPSIFLFEHTFRTASCDIGVIQDRSSDIFFQTSIAGFTKT